MKHVIIVGGGFAGVRAAQRLARHSDSVRVTLISDHQHLEYYPGVFRVMHGAPRVFAEIPYSDIFRGLSVETITGEVAHVAPHEKSVTMADGTVIAGDYLMLAMGSQATYFNIPGAEQTTLPLRRTADVLSLMHHAEHMFKTHATASKEEQVVALRFVVIGGGPSGVELAAELVHYTQSLAKKYSVHPSLITIDIIEARDRLLGMLPESASHFAQRRLRLLGVNIHLNRTLIKNESWTLELSDSNIGARTVIWTAGIEVRETAKNISGFEYGAKGKIVVDQFMQAKGCAGVYIAGDIADTPYSGLAQTAMRHADTIVTNIVRDMRGMTKRAIVHRQNAFAIPLGTGYGLFGRGNWVMTGYIPWLMRSVIDFVYLTGVTSLGWVWRNLIVGSIRHKR